MSSGTLRNALRILAWVVVVGGASPPVRAQVVHEETAQALFADGRRLMEALRFEEACSKFEKSQKLDPTPGTLLNLAVCHEALGKTARAWREYGDLLADPLIVRSPEREQLARERIGGIEPRLARVVFELPHPLPGGFWLSLDEEPVDAVRFSDAIPVDPGPHRVRYGADERQERTSRFAAPAPGTTTGVRLVPLAERHAVAPPVGSRPRAKPASRSWLLPGATFAVAAVAFGATTYFGIRAINRWSTRQRHCSQGCDEVGRVAEASAGRFARAADISLAVGVVATGVGVYFTWKALKEPPPVELNVSIDRGKVTLGFRTSL